MHTDWAVTHALTALPLRQELFFAASLKRKPLNVSIDFLKTGVITESVEQNQKNRWIKKICLCFYRLPFIHLGKASIKKPIRCGHIRKALPPPPPPVKQNVWGHRRNIYFFKFFFDMHISIDSEWPKTYDFERKNQNNLKSFQIIYVILRFRNILHLFLLW